MTEATHRAAGPVTPRDRPSKAYVQVTPSLVAKLGPARAIVWSRIDWRTDPSSFAAVDPDRNGDRWWPANIAQISDETGLSYDQVKRAIGQLEAAGHLESRQKRSADRTKSYRTVISDEGGPEVGAAPPPGMADMTYPSGDIAGSNGAESPDVDPAISPDAPYFRPVKTTEKTSKRTTGAPGRGSKFAASNRKPATEAQLGMLLDTYLLAGDEPDDARDAIAALGPLVGADVDELRNELWGAVETQVAFGRGHYSREALDTLSPAGLAFIERRTFGDPG